MRRQLDQAGIGRSSARRLRRPPPEAKPRSGRNVCQIALAVRVDANPVALGELALEQSQRELVDELALDHPLQRPRAVGGVVAEVAEQGAGVVGELDLDPALADPLRQQVDLELDDPADVLAAEPVEDDDVVDPVQELGLEGRREHLLDRLANRLVDHRAGDPVASRRSRS